MRVAVTCFALLLALAVLSGIALLTSWLPTELAPWTALLAVALGVLGIGAALRAVDR